MSRRSVMASFGAFPTPLYFSKKSKWLLHVVVIFFTRFGQIVHIVLKLQKWYRNALEYTDPYWKGNHRAAVLIYWELFFGAFSTLLFFKKNQVIGSQILFFS